jgi:hypothetical protein
VVTRRIIEATILVVVLSRPVLGAARIWAHKTWNATQPGSISHGVADLVSIFA